MPAPLLFVSACKAAAAVVTVYSLRVWLLEAEQQHHKHASIKHSNNSTKQQVAAQEGVKRRDVDAEEQQTQNVQQQHTQQRRQSKLRGSSGVASQQPLQHTPIIHQLPPADYETRIPVLRAPAPAPTTAQQATTTATLPQLRPSVSPPSCFSAQHAAAANNTSLSLRPAAAAGGGAVVPLPNPLPHTSLLVGQHTAGGGLTCGGPAAVKLLAAAAVAAAAAMFTAVFSSSQAVRKQQYADKQHELGMQLPVGLSSTPAATPTAEGQIAPHHTAALSDGQHAQFNAWMAQQLPAVLASKRAELQHMQDSLAQVRQALGSQPPPSPSASSSSGELLSASASASISSNSSHSSSASISSWLAGWWPSKLRVGSSDSNSGGIGSSMQSIKRSTVASTPQELQAVFGLVEGCLVDQVESLQVQVEALTATAAAARAEKEAAAVKGQH